MLAIMFSADIAGDSPSPAMTVAAVLIGIAMREIQARNIESGVNHLAQGLLAVRRRSQRRHDFGPL